jgi:hypothetical protein
MTLRFHLQKRISPARPKRFGASARQGALQRPVASASIARFNGPAIRSRHDNPEGSGC